jgi:hypothetical protein
MAKDNLSNEIEFVSKQTDTKEINGGFENQSKLAFETTTTGVLMQLEGLNEKYLLTALWLYPL